MMSREFDDDFYRVFATSCGTRMGRLGQMIMQYREGGGSADDLLGTMRMTLHNITGEAKLLGMPAVSRVVVMLSHKVQDIPEGQLDTAHAKRLGISCQMLAKVAEALESDHDAQTELSALEELLKESW